MRKAGYQNAGVRTLERWVKYLNKFNASEAEIEILIEYDALCSYKL